MDDLLVDIASDLHCDTNNICHSIVKEKNDGFWDYCAGKNCYDCKLEYLREKLGDNK